MKRIEKKLRKLVDEAKQIRLDYESMHSDFIVLKARINSEFQEIELSTGYKIDDIFSFNIDDDFYFDLLYENIEICEHGISICMDYLEKYKSIFEEHYVDKQLHKLQKRYDLIKKYYDNRERIPDNKMQTNLTDNFNFISTNKQFKYLELENVNIMANIIAFKSYMLFKKKSKERTQYHSFHNYKVYLHAEGLGNLNEKIDYLKYVINYYKNYYTIFSKIYADEIHDYDVFEILYLFELKNMYLNSFVLSDNIKEIRNNTNYDNPIQNEVVNYGLDQMATYAGSFLDIERILKNYKKRKKELSEQYSEGINEKRQNHKHLIDYRFVAKKKDTILNLFNLLWDKNYIVDQSNYGFDYWRNTFNAILNGEEGEPINLNFDYYEVYYFLKRLYLDEVLDLPYLPNKYQKSIAISLAYGQQFRNQNGKNYDYKTIFTTKSQEKNYEIKQKRIDMFLMALYKQERDEIKRKHPDLVKQNISLLPYNQYF